MLLLRLRCTGAEDYYDAVEHVFSQFNGREAYVCVHHNIGGFKGAEQWLIHSVGYFFFFFSSLATQLANYVARF